jgi:hypothetical protein
MAEEKDLAEKTASLALGTGPKFSFSAGAPAFNPNAFAFVPSCEAPVEEPTSNAYRALINSKHENTQKTPIPAKIPASAPAPAVAKTAKPGTFHHNQS